MLEINAVKYIAGLFQAEKDPDTPRVTVKMGPASAFVAIGAWQLAKRHPDFTASQAELINQLISQLRPIFDGTIGEELLRLGDRPEFDVPRGCKHPLGAHAPECPPGDHHGFTNG